MVYRRWNSVEERFWSKAIPEPNSGCYLWEGTTRKDGSGIFAINGRQQNAAHVALELAGRSRPGELFALHTCDVRCCVNPDHLFWGTQTDNMQDAIAKGRFRPLAVRYGPANGNARYTADTVRQVWQSDGSSRAIGLQFGMPVGTVQQIRAGKTWREITAFAGPRGAAAKPGPRPLSARRIYPYSGVDC